MEELVAELRERTAQVARGGGEKALEKHRSRGKLTARERVDRLLDPDSAFLELSALAAEYPDFTFRPRIGTSLWLGDRGALSVRATVLDAHFPPEPVVANVGESTETGESAQVEPPTQDEPIELPADPTRPAGEPHER